MAQLPEERGGTEGAKNPKKGQNAEFHGSDCRLAPFPEISR